MVSDIKEAFLENPKHIENILEYYGFKKIKLTRDEIRCAYEDGTNPTSVVIWLKDNPNLSVKDFGRNISSDLIGYIMETRNVSFHDVISSMRKELGPGFSETNRVANSFFDGLFDDIGSGIIEEKCNSLPEDVLACYDAVANSMFLRDGISVATQKKFEIGFDVESQRITIPIRNAEAKLIGVKGRCNYVPREGEPKYLYLHPCPMSQTLYGYCQNYPYLCNADVYIFESEKSVMQLDSMGLHNGVALGSNSLSAQQAKLIAELNPTRVIFMLDNSLSIENTETNIKMFNDWNLGGAEIGYFDWRSCRLLDEKDSPTDKGLKVLKRILKENIVWWRETDNEEEI